MNSNQEAPDLFLGNIAEITFVGHGNAISASEGISDHNRPLSPKGLEQAAALEQRLKLYQYDLVLSSPALRAMTTTRITTNCDNPIEVPELEIKDNPHDLEIWALKTAKVIVAKADDTAGKIGHPVNVFVGGHPLYLPSLALVMIEQLPNQDTDDMKWIRESVEEHRFGEAEAIRLNISNRDRVVLSIIN